MPNAYVNKVQLADGTSLIDISDTTAVAADVASGKYFYDATGEKKQGTSSGGGGGGIVISDAPDAGGGVVRTITAVEIGGTKQITANGTGIDVTEYAAVDVAVPSAAPTLETVEHVQPTETNQTITPQSGFDGLASVQIDGISSSYVGSGVTRRTSTDLSASGATVTVPAGYYASQATKEVASGTAGTPTATKGTVSNHSVTVTPSVTNTTGYITGSTKTGTGVSVSASELVSGSETKTANGTYDVTNLASVVVNVASTVSVDTKTVTASNNPVSLDFTDMEGEPKMFTVRLNTSVSSSGSTTYYYIVNITSHGTTTHGNCFRVGSTRQVTSVTSGYSWSYSGTTLTITSSAASRSASPGAFYSGSYELLYVY